jgi:hypothetical protein
LKKRKWFLVDEDVEAMEMQVPRQELQVVEHEPMHLVEHEVVDQEVIDQEVVEQEVVEIQSTPKKVSSVLSARNLHKKNHVIA